MRTLREMLSGRGGQGGQRISSGRNESCRCEEVSEMKPRQLFGLMLRDLAFWKKAEKDASGSTQHHSHEEAERPGPARRT